MATDLEALGQSAVEQAWKAEKLLVRAGKGTRDWTVQQQAELLYRGRVSGFEGSHMLPKSLYPQFAGDPKNIHFLPSTAHYQGVHQGHPTSVLPEGWFDERTGEIISPGKGIIPSQPVIDLTDRIDFHHPEFLKGIEGFEQSGEDRHEGFKASKKRIFAETYPSDLGFALDENHYVMDDKMTADEQEQIRREMEAFDREEGISYEPDDLDMDESMCSDVTTLPKGTVLMRYGSEHGRFFTDPGTTRGEVSLKYKKGTPINYYRLEKPLEMHTGSVRAWNGKRGGGTQYIPLYGRNAEQLVEEGFVSRCDRNGMPLQEEGPAPDSENQKSSSSIDAEAESSSQAAGGEPPSENKQKESQSHHPGLAQNKANSKEDNQSLDPIPDTSSSKENAKSFDPAPETPKAEESTQSFNPAPETPKAEENAQSFNPAPETPKAEENTQSFNPAPESAQPQEQNQGPNTPAPAPDRAQDNNQESQAANQGIFL